MDLSDVRSVLQHIMDVGANYFPESAWKIFLINTPFMFRVSVGIEKARKRKVIWTVLASTEGIFFHAQALCIFLLHIRRCGPSLNPGSIPLPLLRYFVVLRHILAMMLGPHFHIFSFHLIMNSSIPPLHFLI